MTGPASWPCSATVNVNSWQIMTSDGRWTVVVGKRRACGTVGWLTSFMLVAFMYMHNSGSSRSANRDKTDTTLRY